MRVYQLNASTGRIEDERVKGMREQEDICCTCKLDKPWGCNTSIKVKDVVKGVGVVGCGRYEQDEQKAKFYGPWHLPQAIVPTE